MALATRCPHCKTTFRVAADQLKLRGGIVRCGTCSQVFDGNASLVELDAIVKSRRHEPVVPVEEQSDTSGNTIMAQELTDVETAAPPSPPKPAYVLDYDLSEPDPVDYDLSEPEGWSEAQLDDGEPDTATQLAGPVPEQGAPEPEPEPAAEPEPEPALEHELELEHEHEHEPSLELELDPAVLEQHAPAPHVDEPEDWPSPHELDHLHHHDLDIGPLPLVRESAPPPPGPELEPVAAVIAPPVKHEPAPPPSDEPEFVRLHREKEENARRRRLTLGAGSAVLGLILFAQVISNFRNTLAAQYPSMKPVITASCKVLGCKVELPAQIEHLGMETGELQSLSPTSFQLTTLLRNEGSLIQAWPHIELELTDGADKAVVRRVFTPAQYLPASVTVSRGFPARSEQSVKIQFDLKQVKASGFHIAVFYP